jgi:transcriptional regulator with XRE-family HTH domain
VEATLTRVPCVPARAEDELRVLAELVRELRRGKGLTQEQTGLDGGLNRKYFGRLERRETIPTAESLVGIARGLRIEPPAFLRMWADRLEEAADGDA